MSLHPLPVARSQARAGLSWTRAGALVVAGSLAMAIAAHVAVPFWPVPITLQTLVVMVLGALAGPGVAAGAMAAYLAEGLAGLPVFAHGVGFPVLAGPTGGYLIGFIAGAAVIGLLARRGLMTSPLTTAVSLLAAEAVVFAAGVAWLAALFGFEKAIAVGLTPFLLGEALKITLAVAIVEVWRGRRAAE